jgi:hypothetical protein
VGENKMKNNIKTKSIAGILTVMVIALLIIAGPVQGFSLGLSLDDNYVDKGEEVVFTAEIDIASGENLPVDYLVLRLSGPENVDCRFNVDGSIISGCKGITIVANNNANYGYGYGYGYNQGNHYFGYGYGYGYGVSGSKLSYTITLDTSNYNTGIYNTELEAKIGSEFFTKTGDDLRINHVYEGNGNGGNNDDEGCRTKYRCTEWSECSVNGYQNRLCEKVRPICYAGETPEIVRSCTPGETDEGTGSGEINVGNDPEFSNSGITGAAIGSDGRTSGAKAFSILGIVLIVLILGLVTVMLIRRSKKKRVSNYY